MNDCLICGDINFDFEKSGIAKLYSKEILKKSIIWEDDEFFLIPAPGTIVKGYLILATKKHILRFSELESKKLEKISKIYKIISEIGKNFTSDPYIMFEHGGVSCNKSSAACIDHAHMHIIPCKDVNEIRNNLSQLFQERNLNSISNLAQLKNEPPYIFLYENAINVFSYITKNIESQYIRKLIAKQNNIETKWNWKIYQFKDNYLKTIEAFSNKVTL